MYIRVLQPNSFERTLPEFSTLTPRWIQKRPAIDVLEGDHEYTLVAELPGYRKEELTINLEDNILTLSGERKNEERPEEVKVRLNEIGAPSFSRSLRFGSDIDAKQISAQLENGILTVKVPKAESAKPRTIAIQ
jgi:HSP20 family protein